MIRRDCLSKCRRDRAYCYCKSDAIHMFSDVIHVSTLLDIRPFLTIFGFPSPNWGGGTQMWYPLACEVVFACFMLANEKGTRSPTTLGCLAVRESQGNAFCFCLVLLFVAFACVFAVIIAALSARHYRSNASARKSRCRISRFSATVSSLVICVMPVSGRNVCLRPAAISAWLRRRLCAIVTLSSANP